MPRNWNLAAAVGIDDIKKALVNKQLVQLGDGTLGILPDEWLKRYSLLFSGDGIKPASPV